MPALDTRRIECVVDQRRRPLWGVHQPLLASGADWHGYRLEHNRVPSHGCVQRVSAPDHRVMLSVGGICTIRYRAAGYSGDFHFSPGMFCFFSRAYEFESFGWTSRNHEVITVDLCTDTNGSSPIDDFGGTDAISPFKLGITDLQVASLIRWMYLEIEADCPTGRTYAESLSLTLASRIASLVTAETARPRRAGVLSSGQLRRTTDYIRTHIAENLSLESLSRELSLSPHHFARCFRGSTGLTPHQFVLRERINAARRLLATTDCAIGTVAFMLGFASQSHFTDVYRRMTGTTPGRDRPNA